MAGAKRYSCCGLIRSKTAGVWVALACLLLVATTGLAAEPVPQRLRCEYRINPLGIDELQPRLSWVLGGDPAALPRGERQTAYQVLVASSEAILGEGKGDLWDSGRVASDAMFSIAYAGRPLASWQRCFWKVRVWNQEGKETAWSESALWTMGPLGEDDWKDAQWIGLQESETPAGANPTSKEDCRLAARHLRIDFDVAGPIRSATISACGLGLSEYYVNGTKTSDEVLSPPLTQFDKRVVYVTHDVTSLVKPGRNALGAWLGNGRFFAPRQKKPIATNGFGLPRLRCILRIELADGTSRQIASNVAWKITDQGPIRANNEYDGEEYDARQELSGWAEAGYNDSAWKTAQAMPSPGATISARRSPPIRITETVRPVVRTNPRPGLWVFDFGQNLVGWCRLRVAGPSGATVRLRHAETLQPDGMVYTANLRSAQCTAYYTLKGALSENYQPRQTYFGFRYIEMVGYPGEPGPDAIEACVVHDDLESTGDFACSSKLLCRLHSNARWGIRGNYRSIPTDCPQRDERQGWLGDRATGCRGEMHLFDAAAFYEKWLLDIADAQKPNGSVSDVCPSYWSLYNDNVTWAGAITLIPDFLRLQYGDQRVIVRQYPAMRAWVEHMLTYLAEDRMPRDTYGDWCVPPEDPKFIHSKDPARKTNGALIGTAYFQHVLGLMSGYAQLAGKPEDAARYAALRERMKASFQKKFFNAQTARYDNGTQTSSLLPLSLGITPAEDRARVFENLVRKVEGESKSHVGVGLIGIQHLMRVLTDNGRPDLALRIATQEDYPGWGYTVKNGATTIWELWNGNTADPAMNSGNHVMLIGDLLPWFYEYLAGIRPDPSEPGYRRLVLRPVPVAGLDFVRAWRQTYSGRIESQWQREANRLVWNFRVPCGVKALVYVPTTNPASVTEGGKPAASVPGMKFLRQEAGSGVYEVESGVYRVESQL